VVETAQVGAYVAKANGTAREMTAGHLKQGRGTSRSPMQLLADAIDGHTDSRTRWAEYEHGMHGRRQLTYSRGLRELLSPDDVPEADAFVAESSDYQALALLSSEGAAIEPSLWHRISHVDGLDRAILIAFQGGGYPAALACLRHGLDGAANANIEARFRPLGSLVEDGPSPCGSTN
ncbi:MAG: hypothetical protein AAB092_02790, partial [Chloroflexota bacterium]